MKGIHTRAAAHIFTLKAGGCFKGTLLQGKILDRTTRWGIGDMRHKSSDTSGRVTETGALPPGRSNINVRGDSGTHGPSC